MDKIEIRKLLELPVAELQPLLDESRAEGFEFMDRLLAEYLNGSNQFNEPREVLFGAYCGLKLIAIGGLNRDPYLTDSDIARVRHLYVLSAWRNKGIGK